MLLNAGQLIKAAQILESQQNYLEAAFCYAEANTDHPTIPDKHFEWCVNKGLNLLKDKGDTIIDDKIDHYMIEGLYHAALHFGIYYCDYELNKECIRHLSSIPDDDYPVLALTGQFDRMLRKAVDENTPSAFSQAIDLIDNQQSRRNDPENEFILLKLRLLLQRLTDDDQFDFNVKCLISNLLDSHLKLIRYFKPVIELLHQTNAWKYLFLYFSHFHAFRKPDEMESICNPLIDKFLQENQYVPAFFTALISRDKDAIIQSSRDKEGLRTIIECYDKIRNGEPLTIAFEVWKEHQLLPEIIKEAEMVESYHLLGCISEYLKDYRSAGQYFIQAECYYNAQQCFRHIPGPHLETALCYDKLSQPARALKLYAQMQAWDQFIELYHRLPEKSRRTQSIQNVLASILKQDHYPDKIAVLLPTSHDVVQKKLQFDEPTAGHDQQ